MQYKKNAPAYFSFPSLSLKIAQVTFNIVQILLYLTYYLVTTCITWIGFFIPFEKLIRFPDLNQNLQIVNAAYFKNVNHLALID